MPVQDALNSAFAQTEDLTAAVGQQLVGRERQTYFAGVLGHDQRNGERAFASKGMIHDELRQPPFYRFRHRQAAFLLALWVKAISAGSNKLAARKRTTGTATPSPVR